MKKGSGAKGQGPVEVDIAALVESRLHDLLRRLIGAQKIVLELAELEISGGFFAEAVLLPLVRKARKYVSKEMLSEVGVKKLSKSWEEAK